MKNVLMSFYTDAKTAIAQGAQGYGTNVEAPTQVSFAPAGVQVDVSGSLWIVRVTPLGQAAARYPITENESCDGSFEGFLMAYSAAFVLAERRVYAEGTH